MSEVVRLAFVFLAWCAGCATVAVRVPPPIARHGGIYLPWTPELAAHRHEVLACVGLSDTASARPTLWVAFVRIGDEHGLPLVAYYDRPSHAVVFAPDVTMDEFALVFRHEMIHAAELYNGHNQRFRLAEHCQFWPHSFPDDR